MPEERYVIAAMADKEDRLREEETLGRRRGEGEGSAEESSGRAARGLVLSPLAGPVLKGAREFGTKRYERRHIWGSGSSRKGAEKLAVFGGV